MKRWIGSLLLVLLLMALCACGKQGDASSAVTAPVQEVLPAQTFQPAPTPAPAQSQAASADETEASGVDVDLTVLSSTMVYSEVYNMMMAPEEYVGKSVRMRGQFDIYQAGDGNGNPLPDQVYLACAIADATACCSQGIEFVLADPNASPENYPELGAEITVVGTFQSYEEKGDTYYHLADAELE